MDKFPFPNAFSINVLGPSRLFFPFSVNLTQEGEVSLLSLCPLRVIDICDLLEEFASEKVAVFDIVSYGESKTLGESASDCKIQFDQIDSSTIVIATKDLSCLLSEVDHYEFHLFDLNPSCSEVEIIGQIIDCRDYILTDPPVLASLRCSNVYLECYDGHDIFLESNNPILLKRIIARNLQIYAGTILSYEKFGTPPAVPDNLLDNLTDFLRTYQNYEEIVLSDLPAVTEIPNDIMDNFWIDKLDLTILRPGTTYNNGRLRIGVSKQAYNWREEREYPTDFYIVYDVSNLSWAVLYVLQ